MEIEFEASLPEIQSAVSIGAMGARVKIDIPETEIAEVLKLAAYGRGRVLKVSVEVEGEPEGES